MSSRFALAAVLGFCLFASACSKNETPTAPTPTPTPPLPLIVALSGVASVTGGGRIAGATIKVLDGPNGGRIATTDSTGAYVLEGMTRGNANLSANAAGGYQEVIGGVFINGSNALNFTFAVPACQTNNTGMASFGNRSATATQDIVWDGVRITTVSPGQTSDPFTASAGVAHNLQFKVANTQTLACSLATPILSQCTTRVITCAGP